MNSDLGRGRHDMRRGIRDVLGLMLGRGTMWTGSDNSGTGPQGLEARPPEGHAPEANRLVLRFCPFAGLPVMRRLRTRMAVSRVQSAFVP